MALAYLGKDPNSEKPEDYDAVVEAFKPVRKYIKTFDAANYLNALPNKELCVSMTWSGDYATAMPAPRRPASRSTSSTTCRSPAAAPGST